MTDRRAVALANLQVRTWTPEREAVLRRLVRQGLCDVAIAAVMGLSRRAVNGKRWRLRLDANWQRARATPAPTLSDRRQPR